MWKDLVTSSKDRAAVNKATIKIYYNQDGEIKTKITQGFDLSICQLESSSSSDPPRFKIHLANVVSIDRQVASLGQWLDVDLPQTEWRISQEVKPSKHGNHVGYVIGIYFQKGELLDSIQMIMTFDKTRGCEQQRLIGEALVYADQVQREFYMKNDDI